MGSWGLLDKPQHLDMGYQKMSQVELEMLTDRLLKPPKLSATERHEHKRQMKFARDNDIQTWSYEPPPAERPMTTKERTDLANRYSRPVTRSKSSVTRLSRTSSDVDLRRSQDDYTRISATPFKGTKPMTAEELNSSINRLATSAYTTRAKTASGGYSGYETSSSSRGLRTRGGESDFDSESRIMPLGQQTMTAQDISELVKRLATPQAKPRQQLPNIRRINSKNLSPLQISALTERLTNFEEAVDAQRVYRPSQRKFGIVNSFLWKGWN